MPSHRAKTLMIHARIDPKLKKSAESVFSEIGISTTEAIRRHGRGEQSSDVEALSFVPRVARPDLMALALLTTTAFEKDLRRAEK